MITVVVMVIDQYEAMMSKVDLAIKSRLFEGELSLVWNNVHLHFCRKAFNIIHSNRRLTDGHAGAFDLAEPPGREQPDGRGRIFRDDSAVMHPSQANQEEISIF